MDSGFIDILKQLVKEQGNIALIDGRKCKALLSDYTKNEFKTETKLLARAVEAGVAKTIDGADDLVSCKKAQIRVLEEEDGLAPAIAADIVNALALVLRGDTTITVSPSVEQTASPQPIKKFSLDWQVFTIFKYIICGIITGAVLFVCFYIYYDVGLSVKFPIKVINIFISVGIVGIFVGAFSIFGVNNDGFAFTIGIVINDIILIFCIAGMLIGGNFRVIGIIVAVIIIIIYIISMIVLSVKNYKYNHNPFWLAAGSSIVSLSTLPMIFIKRDGTSHEEIIGGFIGEVIPESVFVSAFGLACVFLLNRLENKLVSKQLLSSNNNSLSGWWKFLCFIIYLTFYASSYFILYQTIGNGITRSLFG
jgi:hypothetical protein